MYWGKGDTLIHAKTCEREFTSKLLQHWARTCGVWTKRTVTQHHGRPASPSPSLEPSASCWPHTAHCRIILALVLRAGTVL